MKRTKIILLLTLLFVVTGCYKDHSSTDFEVIHPIKIDMGGAPTTYTVLQYDRLVIEPIIYKNGVADNDMLYEWKVQGNGMPATVIGNRMKLDCEVLLPPNNMPYDVRLTVTDKTTTIQAIMKFGLTVSSKIGEGLLVAHTADDLTTDISHISSMNFSMNVTEAKERIFNNHYSTMNNRRVDGLVTTMQSLVKSDSRTLTMLTAENLYRIDPFDFLYWQKDNDIFYVPYERMLPKSICKNHTSAIEYLNIDGKLFSRSSSMGNYFYTYTLFLPDNSDYSVSKFTTVGSRWNTSRPYAYDELKNRFILVANSDNGLLTFTKQNSGLLFDVNEIGALDALYMGEGEGTTLVTVLKAEKTPNYYIYCMQTKIADNGGNLPVGKYDISNCPDIRKATGFAVSPLSHDFYYSTDKKIYTLALDGEAVDAKERFSIDPNNSDEKITSMMLWRGTSHYIMITDINNPMGNLVRSSNENKMLVLTTYNESTKEGKVVCLPIIRLRDGTIDENRLTHKEYKGFGRITCIAHHQMY